jgi:hypothetical protein
MEIRKLRLRRQSYMNGDQAMMTIEMMMHADAAKVTLTEMMI